MFHLIDCDTDVLEITDELFNAAGFQVQTFDSSTSYLAYVKSPDFEPPLAMISCYKMPYMNGYELISEIRKIFPLQKAVIISGSPEFDITTDMSRLVCRHIAKPYALPELINTLKALNLCDAACGSDNVNSFETLCKFGIRHHCPFYVGSITA